MGLFGRESEDETERAEAWGVWLRRQHPYALAALVLGTFSLTHLGTLLLDGLAAVILGALALRQIRAGTRYGTRLAWIGITLGGVSLLIAMVLYSLPAATG